MKDPADEMDDETGADTGTEDTGADTGAEDDSAAGDAGDEESAEPMVVCTIMYDPASGGFTLVEGDEDDSGEAGEGADDEAGSGEGAEGMPPAAGGVAAAPKGKTYDAPGPLLKAVLDLVKEAQASSGGSEQDNFDAGYGAKSGG